MLENTGRKAKDALDGMRGGWDGLRNGSGRLASRMGIRKTGFRDRMPGTGWSIALASIAALAGTALWMYFRKRRQVTDHYTMGEGHSPWESGAVRDFETTDAYGT